MTVNADGSALCDRCGGDIGNAAVDKAVSIHLLTVENTVLTLHLGLNCKGHCAQRVLTLKALANVQTDAPFTLHRSSGK